MINRAVFTMLLLSLFSQSTEAKEHTNVVFFLADDLGYMDIGANNPETFYETPHIDQLAASGVRFTNGYAANPVCSPTRYSIMTGKYPSRIDVTNYFSGKRAGKFEPAPLHDRMPLNETTLAEAFKAKGYHTFFGGKWHLGPDENFWPEKHGFDVNAGGMNRGGPYGGKKYFSPYGNPRLADGPDGEHLPDRLASEACDFITRHQAEPFLVYLSFYSVHTPLMCPEPLKKKYQEKAEKLGLKEKTAFAPEEQNLPGNQKRQVRTLQAHAVYAGMIESMDKAVGKVLTHLKKLNLDQQTAVCFMSDNGGLSTSEGSPTSNLPLRAGKGWLYEGGIREPFIISWPQVAEEGSVSDVPVISTDFYPTLLEIAGIDALPEQHLDGVSLTGILKGEQTELSREALFWHYPHYSNQGGMPGGAVRMGDWKLIERLEDGRTHLYNLKSDIGEQTDLAEQYPEKVKAMKGALHQFYRETDAKFLRPNKKGEQPYQPF